MKSALSKAINLKDFNLKVRPTDDFFEYTNGGWLKRNPIPRDQAKWGTFNILRERANARLKKIFNELSRKAVRKGSDEQKLKDYYLSGLNIKARDRRGLADLHDLLCEIDSINNHKSLFRVLGALHKAGTDAVWAAGIDIDDKDSSRYIFRLHQGGLGLPDRDYYLKSDPHNKKIRKAYKDFIVKLFALSGAEKEEAEKSAQAVLKVETALARASWTKVKLRDPHANYNKYSFSDLLKKYPDVLWQEYFSSAEIPKVRDLIVSQPPFFRAAGKLMKSTSLALWRTYFKYHLLADSAPYMGEEFRKNNFEMYGKTLFGLKKMKPLWKGVIAEIDSRLGEALGREYVRRFFSPHAKKHVIEMTKNIKSAMKERILALDWMSKETKKKALLKLGNFGIKIGYPDKWLDYSRLEISRESYLKNHLNASRFEWRRNMDKLTKKTVDRKEWHMTPQTVNAYYSHNLNEIAFPAAILEPPFFSDRAPDALNYGGIGTVIGHEITHGFDDTGSKFDAYGNLKNWWSGRDKKLFNAKTKVLEKQFNNFEPVPGTKINGKLTLGENIADLGGLILAYHAYLKSPEGKKLGRKLNGFNDLELFFLSYAITERANATEAYTRMMIMNDSHSPNKYRVLGPLSNMDEFYEAFGCKLGDRMYIPPEKRARIW